MTDTNRILQELRKLLFETINHNTMQRMQIAELFSQLDQALSNGGRLPIDWIDAVRPLAFPQAPHGCPVCKDVHPLPLCKPTDPQLCGHGSS